MNMNTNLGRGQWLQLLCKTQVCFLTWYIICVCDNLVVENITFSRIKCCILQLFSDIINWQRHIVWSWPGCRTCLYFCRQPWLWRMETWSDNRTAEEWSCWSHPNWHCVSLIIHVKEHLLPWIIFLDLQYLHTIKISAH